MREGVNNMGISKELIGFLKESEGYRQFVYKCPAGKSTVGYGLNLEDRGVTEAEADYLLRSVVADVERNLAQRIAFWDRLDRVRQEVLIDMAYNMGVGGLLGFRKTLGFIEAGDYASASTEMLVSRWATQVGGRANKLSRVMLTGSWE
jgi:lysozyme